jgi:hypothetical protein
LVPIVIWNGKVVDGRHRARLCEELGIKLRIDGISARYKTNDEMVAYVRALNEHRRSNTKPLTNEEKRSRSHAAIKANPEKSNRQLAEKTGFSHVFVASVRREMEEAGELETLPVTTGKDGKLRPAHKPTPKPKPLVEPSQEVEHPEAGTARHTGPTPMVASSRRTSPRLFNR